MTLHTAADLMRMAGRSDLLQWRRAEPVTLAVHDASIVLNDQRTLDQEKTVVARDWTFGDFVEFLNAHVYFWPGTADGPISVSARPRIDGRADRLTLRVRTDALFAQNSGAAPLFCALNFSAARERGSRRVRRSERLFTPADQFPGGEAEVVQFAYRTSVVLPAATEVLDAGEWRMLRQNQ